MSFVSQFLKKKPDVLGTLEVSKKFMEHFPKKKTINKLLFDLNSRLTYKKLYPIYVGLYHGVPVPQQQKLLDGVKGSDLIVMRNVLEKVRNRTRYARPDMLKLEDKLLELAAELGNNDAIAILSFRSIRENMGTNSAAEANNEEVTIAKKLFKDLYNINHLLAIKLLGDLALEANNWEEALTFYNKYINIAVKDNGHLLTGNDDLTGEVYGKLGEIEFTYLANMTKAEEYWQKCLELTSVEDSVRWYFLAAQIYMSSEPLKSRILLEKAASQGFKESLTSLGFLEMNYFRDYGRAKEWFKLGMEVFELQSFIGFFDCCVKNEDWIAALKCLKSIEKIGTMESFGSDNTNKATVSNFMNSRAEFIDKVRLKSALV
ncbi:Protein MSS2, mitochondrial [Nakaseomyces glabratus]|uniref:Protein MSS2, mitochondrial n=1 Tax=Candida glabrata TaxID=5478 RepID=A0A0W0CM16_CANGB|nr:hypothetical protein J7298_02520 [Nakaseomyces glabratus]KAH7588025.1 hypothetical protein J7297_02515 [Nakaseomyces glabratus]KAH7592411.1 hypothetical protein J7296_02513 [Nakaseomyces glabratus]KAH7601057.1 hypothetical protein J7295_02526 [Nakaseomyces glabratus]KAH7613496.1 hypothetical protein J7292_02503 [Nakaseomyces glabratus]